MKRFAAAAALLFLVATPSFCKTHVEPYPLSCSVLRPAVKDTLRNSGKYGILGIDNTEMTASFVIVGARSAESVSTPWC
jgi:hypothetical protein